MLCFRFTVFAARTPVGKGTIRTRSARPSRAYFRVLYCFQSRSSPASSCWPVHCVSLSARTASLRAALPTPALRRYNRSPQEAASFPRVVAHTARSLFCPGGYPVLLVCTFQGTARGDSEPLTVLPKIAFGEYPYFEEFSKHFLRSRRMRSLRLMTARWLTPILWAHSRVDAPSKNSALMSSRSVSFSDSSASKRICFCSARFRRSSRSSASVLRAGAVSAPT